MDSITGLDISQGYKRMLQKQLSSGYIAFDRQWRQSVSDRNLKEMYQAKLIIAASNKKQKKLKLMQKTSNTFSLAKRSLALFVLFVAKRE